MNVEINAVEVGTVVAPTVIVGDPQSVGGFSLIARVELAEDGEGLNVELTFPEVGDPDTLAEFLSVAFDAIGAIAVNDNTVRDRGIEDGE